MECDRYGIGKNATYHELRDSSHAVYVFFILLLLYYSIRSWSLVVSSVMMHATGRASSC